MADKNSPIVANQVAIPPVMNDVGVSGGRMRVVTSHISLVESMNGEDKLALVRLPSAARLHSLRVKGESITAALDLGLYHPDGSEADADCLASGSTPLNSDVDTWVEILGDGLTPAASAVLAGARLWEAAGLDEDPGGVLELALTMAATSASEDVTDVDSDIAFLAEYTID